MARGAEAKLRRRNRRKNGNDDDNNDNDDDEVIDMFGDGSGDMPFPLGRPPAAAKKKTTTTTTAVRHPKKKKATTAMSDDDDDSDYEDINVQGEIPLPMPKKKKKTASGEGAGGAAVAAAAAAHGSKGGGIKTTPLIFLFLMVGTAVLPVLIYAGDYMSSWWSKTDLTGSLGYTLGLGAVPRKRTVAFYEKHAPEKLHDVPKILSKNYGDYPQLIKKLERKYQDYGYFMGWEDDEALFTHVKQQAKEWYDIWLQQYWNRHAPQQLKTAFRNIRYNVTFLYKKGRRLYRKHVWPMLEPIFGVPQGTEAQKRKDAAEARKRREQAGGRASSSGRRKNKDFRDDVED